MTRQSSTAVRAVLWWNLLPFLAIVAGVLIGATDPDDKGGWSMLFAIFLGIFGGAALIMSIGVGILIARAWVRRASRSRRPDTFGVGTLSALLGWLVAIAVVAVILVIRTVAIQATA